MAKYRIREFLIGETTYYRGEKQFFLFLWSSMPSTSSISMEETKKLMKRIARNPKPKYHKMEIE